MFKKKKAANTISTAELSAFCSQVALILDAGIPLYDGIETLAEGHENENTPAADMIRKLSQKVTETGSLYQGLKEDDRWPDYMAEMVGIGEQTGHLEEVMSSLSSYYEREGRIRESISDAVTYPFVLGVMLVVIVFVMLWKVLPVFQQVINGMGITLNSTGMGLMRVGEAIGWVVMGLVILALIAAIVCVILLRTPLRVKVIRFLNMIFPPFKKMQKKLSASRIASVMSMMLSSGFPMDEALRMTMLVLSDEESIEKVKTIRDKVEQGESMADGLDEAHIFDELHTRMVRIGAATGREDAVMDKVAGLYEEQVEGMISHMIGIIEPTMVAVLAVVIGAILLAVMLPMTGVLTSMM